jgi:EmrB/QacA subfamily drug resistance transporter
MSSTATVQPVNPWSALWAMLVGFFMILLDTTIVAVANPGIMAALGITDYDTIVWVTSGYLLAYAVPLLVAGRLGDRFGPKNVYLAGLALFTAASLWCGLSSSIGMLVAARVAQGVGAALLTPQTLTTITRLFPSERRGAAMSVWGATAGVATLVGPLAGGVLVDTLGWSWIFFVNVPVGLVGLVLAARLVPALPTHPHRFDVAGVALSGVGLFCIVFGLQEGEPNGWVWWIWVLIASGVGLIAVFLRWQAVNPREPLIPLSIFTDRNFSLANLGIAAISFATTAMFLPLMFYAQSAAGLSPARAALLTAPMAVASGGLAPLGGWLVDRARPGPVIGSGFCVLAVALGWLAAWMTPGTPVWRLALPLGLLGMGMAFVWGPLAATATRNLPSALAGAGSGVYNTTRQVGAVLGSAAMAALMSWRVAAEPLGTAMAQSMLMPAAAALFGVLAAAFLVGSAQSKSTPALR